MSYEKQIWQTGDIITADKLNHIEDGINNGGSEGNNPFLIVRLTSEWDSSIDKAKFTTDKTWREIQTAYPYVIFLYDRNGVGDDIAYFYPAVFQKGNYWTIGLRYYILSGYDYIPKLLPMRVTMQEWDQVLIGQIDDINIRG